MFSWLPFADQTLFALSFLTLASWSQSCAHLPQGGLRWTEDGFSGESLLPGSLIKYKACYTWKYLWGLGSDESRIIFLPERSSICQYLPKISAINIKKQSRTRLLLAHPVLYILKIQKTNGTFWKPLFQNQPKSVRLQATYGNLHYLRKWFRQCNLSSLNLTPYTIAYLLILYLQST